MWSPGSAGTFRDCTLTPVSAPCFSRPLPSIAIPLRWAGNDVGRDRDYNASTTRALPAAGTAQQTSAVPSTRLAEGAVG